MKILKTKTDSITLEIDLDEIGLLHYALCDYLTKFERKCKCRELSSKQLKLCRVSIEKLHQMVETVSLLI